MHWCPAPLQDPAFYATHNPHELNSNLCLDAFMSRSTRLDTETRVLEVLTDPHTGKALVIANQSRNMRSNTRRSVNSAVRAAYRSLAAFFIDLRPK